MKRFGQVVLQVESCSMDAILQIFKWSIGPGTPYFEFLTKKPPSIMDDLFRQVDKYSMLEDDVQVGTQQVLVTNLPTKDDKIGSSKPLNQSRQVSKRRDDQQQQNQAKLTSVSISYERLLPMIHNLSDIRWLESIKTDPTKWDWNRRCLFHKNHGHTTEQCKSPYYLVEKLIRVGHLKQYVHIASGKRETVQEVAVQAPASPAAPKAIINYIHGGPIDDRHSSKQQRQSLLM